MTDTPTPGQAVSNAYRARVRSLAAANGTEAPDFDAGEPENPAVEDEPTLPTKSWKKDDIVQWLVDEGVIESADEVDGQTKDQLFENFFEPARG